MRKDRHLLNGFVAIIIFMSTLTAVTLGSVIQSQACTYTPDNTKPSVTETVSAQTAGTYYLWSRLKAPDATNNSFYLQVDGSCAMNVGDNANIPANTWTWVNYQDGNPGIASSVNLTAGTHQIVVTARESAVGIDRVEMLTDQTCVPTGTGGNCTPVTDTTPPSIPTNLAATANSSTQINLSWSASTDNIGITAYKIYRNGSGTPLTTVAAPTTTYSDNNLAAGTTYSYTVTAIDAAGNESAHSSSVSATTSTAGDTTAPSPPSNVSATTVTTNSVTLAWGASTDNVEVAGYRVWRGDGNWSNWVSVGATSPSTLTFTNSGLNSNTTYTFAVRAYDAAGNISDSSNSIKITTKTADTTPPTISISTPANGTTLSNTATITASATDNVGVTGVQFKLDGASLGATLTSSPYNYTWDTTKVASGSHTLTAIASDAAGNTTTSTAVTVTIDNTTSDTTPPSTPTNLQAQAASASQINLSWSAATDNVAVVGYRVYRNNGSNPIVTVSSTSFGDSGLTASTMYSYTVTAIDAAGNQSPQSASVSATTPAQPATTTVIGTVTSQATGNAIAGAYIYTGKYATRNGAATAYTNAQGQYVLSGITPNKKHTYHYTAIGYKSQFYGWSFPAGIITEDVQL